jgi:hypothetical protein
VLDLLLFGEVVFLYVYDGSLSASRGLGLPSGSLDSFVGFQTLIDFSTHESRYESVILISCSLLQLSSFRIFGMLRLHTCTCNDPSRRTNYVHKASSDTIQGWLFKAFELRCLGCATVENEVNIICC